LKTKATIEHPLLPPFEPQLKAILEMGFDGGVRALSAAGYRLGDDLVNEKAREHFNDGLLSAFGETQSVVGELFIQLEQRRRELLEQLKTLRSNRVAPNGESRELLEAIENRQIILRRLMDGILWVLLPEAWIINHFAIKRDLTQPDPGELAKLLAIASKQNRESKRELHLVSDLTTIVQIGDIVRIRWDENGLYLRLQEVKSGKVNEALSDMIESAGGVLSERNLAEIESKFGRHARAQALRMVKQQERLNRFSLTLENKSRPPEVPKNELMEALTKTVPPRVKSYLPLLPKVVADVKLHGISVHRIDGCLWIAGVSEKWLADFGGAKKLLHFLFHLKNPALKCHPGELEALKQESPLINLAALNMNDAISRSPLIWYPKELVLDVITGRIIIFVQFDLNAFFRLAKKAGFELSLITGKKVQSYMRQFRPMVENPKAYGINVRFPNEKELPFRPSVFRSVYSHLVKPSEIVKLLAIVDKAQEGRKTPT
jgi:hypothetical protein